MSSSTPPASTPRSPAPARAFRAPPRATLTSFSVKVPWVPGTEKIELVYDGTSIATLLVSPTAPTVTVCSPAAGAVFSVGETVTVNWTGVDADGGTLRTCRCSPSMTAQAGRRCAARPPTRPASSRQRASRHREGQGQGARHRRRELGAGHHGRLRDPTGRAGRRRRRRRTHVGAGLGFPEPRRAPTPSTRPPGSSARTATPSTPAGFAENACRPLPPPAGQEEHGQRHDLGAGSRHERADRTRTAVRTTRTRCRSSPSKATRSIRSHSSGSTQLIASSCSERARTAARRLRPAAVVTPPWPPDYPNIQSRRWWFRARTSTWSPSGGLGKLDGDMAVQERRRGRTWSAPTVVAQWPMERCGSHREGQFCAQGDDVYVTCYLGDESHPGDAGITYSHDGGATFSAMETALHDVYNSGVASEDEHVYVAAYAHPPQTACRSSRAMTTAPRSVRRRHSAADGPATSTSPRRRSSRAVTAQP